LELILFFSGICALAILAFIFNWRWIERRRKEDDPELSWWLGWSRLSSIPEAEIFLRLLVRPNASGLSQRARIAVVKIRIAMVTLFLGVARWLFAYYLATGSLR
jgi:hypothetical protein